MFGLNKKTYTLVMEEKDVTAVLAYVNHHLRYDSLRVGNCGWGSEYHRWFVMFHASEATYGAIVKDLLKIGKFRIDVRPGGKVDYVFERGT